MSKRTEKFHVNNGTTQHRAPYCQFLAFFFCVASSSTPSVFLFSATLELFLEPSVGTFSFFALAALVVVFFSFFSSALFPAAFVFFAPVFAFGVCFFSAFCSVSSSPSSFSSSFSLALLEVFFSFSSLESPSFFFVPADLACGVPFSGLFFEPGSFS
jgi:hypothetical protein